MISSWHRLVTKVCRSLGSTRCVSADAPIELLRASCALVFEQLRLSGMHADTTYSLLGLWVGREDCRRAAAWKVERAITGHARSKLIT